MKAIRNHVISIKTDITKENLKNENEIDAGGKDARGDNLMFFKGPYS